MARMQCDSGLGGMCSLASSAGISCGGHKERECWQVTPLSTLPHAVNEPVHVDDSECANAHVGAQVATYCNTARDPCVTVHLGPGLTKGHLNALSVLRSSCHCRVRAGPV